MTRKYKNVGLSNKILKSDIVKKSLDNLYGYFFIGPHDKANDKITIISRRFYMQGLIESLSIFSKLSANSTYENLPNTNKTFYFSLILGLFFKKLTIGKWGKSMSTFNLLDSWTNYIRNYYTTPWKHFRKLECLLSNKALPSVVQNPFVRF